MFKKIKKLAGGGTTQRFSLIVKFLFPKNPLLVILNSLILTGFFCFTFYAFASYNPGDTLDPACNPTDPSCVVTSPITGITGAGLDNVFTGTNGLLKKTSAGTYTLDTNTYLTSLNGAALTDQTTPQTIGLTGSRLAKLWATDITVTNPIAGSITGNAGTATTATNISGGLGGQIPYQSAAGTTALLVNGTTGQVLQSNGTTSAPSWVTLPGGGDALVANPLSQFASTTSAQLLGVLSDESGTGNILTTNGSAASLTSFPTFNQNTSGTAAGLSTILASTSGGSGINNAGNLTWGSGGTLGTNAYLSTAFAPLASPTFTGTVSGITAAMVGAPSGSGTSSGSNTGDQTITLTGGVTGSGIGSFATTVVTNANLTGDVTSVGNATTLTNAPVIAKVLTGYTSGAGVVAATDSILQAIQKLNGNIAASVSGVSSVNGLSGAVALTGTANQIAISNANVFSIPVNSQLSIAKITNLTSNGLVKTSGSDGTLGIDTNTYLTTIGTGVANQLTYWSGTNAIGSLDTATYPSLTELSYVKGVTSGIQSQLNGKQASGSYQPLNTNLTSIGGLTNATGFLYNNGSGTFSYAAAGAGDMVLSGIQTVTGAKTFNDTKLLLRNVANTFNGSFVNTNTADRVYTLKDASGTLAFTSDITGTNSGTNTGDNSVNSNYASDYRVGNFVAGTNYLAPNGSAASLTSLNASNISTGILGILYGGTGATTATGATGNLQFLQTGTSAVARSLDSKLKDTISVKDFGAVGDGVTDDTAAIQAALNLFTNGNTAIATGSLYFPEGTYKITSTLYYSGSTGFSLHMFGAAGASRSSSGVLNAGSRLTWAGAAGGTLFVFLGANEITVDDMEFSGGSSAKYVVHLASTNTINTTLGTVVTPGSRTVTPGSMSSITTGTILNIDSGANFELVYVTGTSGSTFTATFAKSHGTSATVGNSQPSSGLVFRRVGFMDAAGTGSAEVAMGSPNNSSEQVSEVQFQNCNFMGNGTAENGFLTLNGNNVKNIQFSQGNLSGNGVNINWTNSSGTMTVVGTIMSMSTVSDFKLGAGNLHIEGLESENVGSGSTFVTGNMGSNPGSLTVVNSSWQGTAAADDIIIAYNGNISLTGNTFFNLRTGSSVPKIEIIGPYFSANQPSTIFSQGNYYQNAAAGYAPFVTTDGGHIPLLPSYYDHQSVDVTSLGDYGGTNGSIVKLNNYFPVHRIVSAGAAHVADTGILALGSTDIAVAFRNNANTGDVVGLSKDSSDVITVGGAAASVNIPVAFTAGATAANTIVVSGDGGGTGGSPNGTYTYKDQYNSANRYQRGTDSWYIYYSSPNWYISTYDSGCCSGFNHSGTTPTPPLTSGWNPNDHTGSPVTVGGPALVVNGLGNVGIGTASPGELLSLGLAGTNKGVLSLAGNTSGKIIIQPQAVAGTYTLTLPSTAGSASQFLQTDGSGNLAWATGSGGSSTLSGLTAATGTNNIDSLNFAQTWNWSTAATENPFTMNFNALTTGSAMSLLTSNASLASTNGFFRVANTGAATGTSIFARLQPNSTEGSGLTILNNGNVGVGVTNPLSKLHISAEGATQVFMGDIYSDTAGNVPEFSGRRARGTQASPSAIQAGDAMMLVGARGYMDSGAFSGNKATIRMFASENFTSTTNGTYITFETTPIGTTGRTEKMRILDNGNVGIGTTSPGTKLAIGSSDLGSGVAGPIITLGINNNASPGAGSINFLSNLNANGFVWQDAAGLLRINTSAPTNALDTSGTVVGLQSSSLSSKNVIGEFTDYQGALQTILDAPLYNFTYKSGAYNGEQFTGIVTDSSPIFGMDKDSANPSGKSLNVINGLGYAFGAIKELNLNLEGVSGTITPLAGSPSELFVTAFFNNIKEKIGVWFADAGNGIVDLYATVIHSDKVETKEVNTDKLCVKKSDGTNVCVTGDQLDSLLTGTKESVTNNTGGSGNSDTIVCTGKQTLVNNVCTDPAPVQSIPTCTSPQVLDTTTNTCVTPAPVVPTCISPQTLVNNVCTDPAPVVPVCTSTQTLVNNVCTDPVVPATDTSKADGTVAI